MNKIFQISFLALALCLLTACGKITVKGADGTEYESYQECCAANDYDAAHKYLAKVQNSDREDFSEASEYVFKSEALFLMSQGDEASKKRIIYLLKEEGNNSDHISMLIDLAIEDDDEDFVKQLANQYKVNPYDEDLKKLTSYLLAKGTDDNKEYVKSLLTKLGEEDLLLSVGMKDNNLDLIDEYINKKGVSLDNNELVNYLASLNQRKYSDMILSELLKEEKNIPQKPTIGKARFIHPTPKEEFISDCNTYSSAVTKYNNMCRDVLAVAINKGNIYILHRELYQMPWLI